MKTSTVKKMASLDSMEFHDYKYAGNAGRKGVKKRKKKMKRKTRQSVKALDRAEGKIS